MVATRRLLVVLVLALVTVAWSAVTVSGVGHAATASSAAAGSLQADFDNDGFVDLAVGVPHEAIGTAAAAGAVNVLYGSAAGLASTGSQAFWQGPGGAAGALEGDDRFGSALAAGDFNADGVDDLAVGAPGEDVGTAADAGAVSVLYGSAGGLTGTGSQQFRQGAGGVGGAAEPDDRFGWALAAGGFNTNGAADLAVGVPLEDIGTVDSAGAVNVLYGRRLG